VTDETFTFQKFEIVKLTDERFIFERVADENFALLIGVLLNITVSRKHPIKSKLEFTGVQLLNVTFFIMTPDLNLV
jgi:hypothetical protein